MIESAGRHDVWGTVSVSENIIEASWIALVDAIEYKLYKDHAKTDPAAEVPVSSNKSMIGHTIGAAGAGAQVAVVFGNAYLGIASAILTLLMLIFS